MESRFAFSRQVVLAIDHMEPTTDERHYTLLPSTLDANVFLNYTLTVASSSADVRLEKITQVGPGADWAEIKYTGAWSASQGLAGGCPQLPTGVVNPAWTSNPQLLLTCSTAGSRAVGVLRLTHDLPAHLARHNELEARLLQARADGDEEGAAEAQQSADEATIGLFVVCSSLALDLSKGAPLTGEMALGEGDVLLAAPFRPLATEQLAVEVVLPEPGDYALVACTYGRGIEAPFELSLYSADGAVASKPLRGLRAVQPAADKTKGAKKVKGEKQAPPVSKHDVSKLRSEAADKGDDGTLGYAQRLEIEEALRLSKAPENVPIMTREGAPLSENVKKRKDALVKQALDYCAAHGGKFEDSGDGGFPSAPGTAEGAHQPAVYKDGDGDGRR